MGHRPRVGLGYVDIQPPSDVPQRGVGLHRDDGVKGAVKAAALACGLENLVRIESPVRRISRAKLLKGPVAYRNQSVQFVSRVGDDAIQLMAAAKFRHL